jgi:hypothetical protein
METFWVNSKYERNSIKLEPREGPLNIVNVSLGEIPEEQSRGEFELDLAESGRLLPFTPESATGRTGSVALDTETMAFLDDAPARSFIDC